MTGPIGAWRAAMGLFTVIPMPTVTTIDRPLARRSMLAMPWVGLTVGVLAALAALVVQWTAANGPLAAIMGLVVLTASTGGLHLDGLADTADGLASRTDAESALRIMKQSDIGPMGVIWIVLVLLLDAGALASLSDRALLAALVAAPMTARLIATAATSDPIPAARPGGFGALFAGVSAPREVLADAVAVLGVAAVAGWLGAGVRGSVVFGAGTVLAWGIGWWWAVRLRRRLGGLTGDTFGSVIEVTQVAFLLVLAAGVG